MASRPVPCYATSRATRSSARLVNKNGSKPLTIHWQGMRGERRHGMGRRLSLRPPLRPARASTIAASLTDPGLFCYRPSVYPVAAS